MKNMNKIHYILFTLAALLVSTSTWAAGKVTFKTYSGPKITAKYSATGNTIVETTTDGATSDITSVNEVTTGALVTLTIAASDTKYLSGLTIQAVVDAGAAAPRRALEIVNTISYTTKTKYVSYEFVMPNYDVWITPTFADRKNISSGTYEATINLVESSHVYDWLAHTPAINNVTISSGSVTLTEGTDYTVSGISAQTEAGSYPITVEGKGEYKGEKIVYYTIDRRPITDATIMLSNESYVYKKGTKQYSTIDRVYLNGNLLSNSTTNGYNNVKYYEGTDVSGVGYDATDDNFESQNVGTYSIKITGTGNYTGTATKTYTITKRDIATCTVTGNSYTYDGSAQYPTTSNITVSDGYGDLDNTDYDIKYWNGTAWETTPTPATTEIGAYTFKLEGKGNNYSGSKEVPYYINSNNNIDISYTNTHVYTGSQITATDLDLVVKDGGTTLTYETHYDVVYSNNTNVGPAQFTVIGINGYNFYYTKGFSITPKSVNAKTGDDDDITITLSETSFNYNASTQKPTVTVKDGTTPLVENKDYTLSNPGAINAGTYHVSITGIGNYKDAKTSSSTYTINKLSLTGAEITLLTNTVTYDGTAQTPPIKQVKIGDVVITEDDYDLDWANNTNAAPYNHATAPPTVTVKAKTSGTINLSDSETKTFTIEKKSIANVDITLVPASFTYKNGVTQRPTTVTVKDKERNVDLVEETDYTLTNNGGVEAGTYDVTVTGTGNYKGTAKKYYTISEQAGTTAITVADIADLIYTGEAIKPIPTVQYTYEDDQSESHTVTLTNDTHYTLSYENNVNVGTANVIVTLKGGYTGSTTKTFKIVARPLGEETTPEVVAAATVTSTSTTLVYNGNVQHATFTVVKKGRTLTEGVDYEVTYNGDGTSAGTQNVTINGIGNYSSSVTGTYSIAKLSLNTAVITLPATRFEYSRGAQEPTPVVSVGNFVIPSANYDVRWDNDADATNTADVTNIGTKTVYVTGKSNCDGSKSTDYNIVAKQIDASMVTLTHEVMTYTGSALDPVVVVTDKGVALTKGTDTAPQEYKVELTNNTKVGTATVTVEGQGNYTGKVQKTFVIKEKDSGVFTIADIDAVTYDGTAHQPTPNVKYSGTDLTLNTDYTLSYINNVNAGTAIVTVTGKGGYQGSTGTKTFTINPKTLTSTMVTLSNFTVTGDDPGFTYNGNNQKPNVTITDAAAPIIADDYDITNAGGVDANDTNNPTYSVTITGKRNYTGTVNLTYKIYPMSITTAEVALSYNNIVYNGVAQKPTVRSVYANGHLLTSTTDYTLSWPDADYTNQGAKNVTVTGTGNYKDSRTVQYTIDKKPLVSDMIKIANENLTYTGSAQTAAVTIEDLVGSTNIITSNDYTLTNPGGTAVGNYTVTIDGKGNYKGSASKQYSIIAQGATGFTVDEITETFTYKGAAWTPAVTVKKASTTDVLTLNMDYTVAYSDNTNVGTATVTVTGKGNYSGTRTVNFTIAAKTLADGMVALSSTSFTYTGSEQKPAVTVTDTDTNTPLTLNTDYQVIYPTDAISQGTKTITVKGIGNYTGEVAKTYSIGLLSLNDASVTLNELSSYVYDGLEKKPTVREVTVGTMVVPTTGYTVSYPDDLINIGTKTMTITGKGN